MGIGDLDPMEEVDGVTSWQVSLERFERFYWPLFKLRGYDKNYAYLYWMLNQLTNTIEMSSGTTQRDDDGDEWKRSS